MRVPSPSDAAEEGASAATEKVTVPSDARSFHDTDITRPLSSAVLSQYPRGGGGGGVARPLPGGAGDTTTVE